MTEPEILDHSNTKLRFVVDMCLPRKWVEALRAMGHEALRWDEIGDEGDPDSVIMEWARREHYVVVTQDLDFGRLLARGRETNPSVIQLHLANAIDASAVQAVQDLISQYRYGLLDGAFVSIDQKRRRVRSLPIDTV